MHSIIIETALAPHCVTNSDCYITLCSCNSYREMVLSPVIVYNISLDNIMFARLNYMYIQCIQVYSFKLLDSAIAKGPRSVEPEAY